jgi:hypothetical protein
VENRSARYVQFKVDDRHCFELLSLATELGGGLEGGNGESGSSIRRGAAIPAWKSRGYSWGKLAEFILAAPKFKNALSRTFPAERFLNLEVFYPIERLLLDRGRFLPEQSSQFQPRLMKLRL